MLATNTNTNKITITAPSVLLIICLIGLPQISETIYAPALPAITLGLATTTSLVQWSLSVYFVGFALGVGFWGDLSDRVGRKPVMLMGIIIYLCMSLVCSSSQTITILLLARFFQAFGISVGSVVTQTIMRDCFTGIERNKIFSIAGMAIALAPALGPLLGGYLTESFSWRSNFIMLSAMGALLLLYAYNRLPETRAYSIQQSSERSPLSRIALLKKMLCDKHIIASSILVGGFNGILFSYYSESPYIFIDLFKLDPAHYGMLGIFMAMGVCLGSFISHRINRYIDATKLIKILCYSLSMIMLIFTLCVVTNVIQPSARPFSITLIMTFMMLFYVIFGICIPNILSKALVNYPANVGAASAILGLIYYVWVAVCVFGIGAFLPNSLFIMPAYFLVISIIMALSCQFLVINKDL